MRSTHNSIWLLLAWASSGFAQAPHPIDRFAARSLDEVQTSIATQPGFSVELVASEPMISSPVAIDFDASGDLWVVEMIDYSEQEQEALGRVSRLRDTDADGRMDRSEVVVEHLSWPTGLARVGESLYVVAPPHLMQWAVPSSHPSGVASSLALTGFGRQNVQGMANSFRWGLDGRLHLSTSSNGGNLTSPAGSQWGVPSGGLTVSGRDIAWDPVRGTIHTVVGYGQHGMDFSPWGDRFVCSNSDHLQQVVAWQLPELTDASLSQPLAWRRSIAADGPQAEVYRISPVEPWREARTQMRLSGASIGLLEGGGRASGYFTSATGVTIYDGDQWPPTETMTALVADVGSNLVHRKRLVTDGVAFRGERIDVESEFVRSTDTWFRPVQFTHGPDGCLYIVDMARETIEHPKSLPEPIKSQLDLTSGRDRGRIWRVVANGRPIRRDTPQLDRCATEALVTALEHPNAWHREVASQRLILMQDPHAIPALRQMVESHPDAFARLHAWAVLTTFPEGVDGATWLAALRDPHAKVRVWAWSLMPRFHERLTRDERAMAVQGLATESDLEVRMVAAVRVPSLFEGDDQGRARTLRMLVHDDWECDELRAAVESASAGTAVASVWNAFVDPLEKDPQNLHYARWRDALVYQMHEADTLTEWVHAMATDEIQDPGLQAKVASLARLLERRLIKSPDALAAIRSLSARLGGDPIDSRFETLTSAERRPLMRLMSTLAVSERVGWFRRLLDPSVDEAIQTDAIECWVGSEPESISVLCKELPRLSPSVVARAFSMLVRSEAGLTQILDELEQQRWQPEIVPAWVWQSFRSHPNASLVQRAGAFDRYRAKTWESIATEYRSVWGEPGDPDRGETLFRKWCASCHRVQSIGISIGPSLDSYRTRPNEAIALAIAEPSREMDAKYEQHQVRTVDGETVVGLLVGSNAHQIQVRTAQDVLVTVSKEEVEVWSTTGKSLMPEGLLQELTPAALNDLIAFLRSHHP